MNNIFNITAKNDYVENGDNYIYIDMVAENAYEALFHLLQKERHKLENIKAARISIETR